MGSVSLLAEPKIVDAYAVDGSTVDVTFNVDVSNVGTTGLPDVADFIINAAGTASAGYGGTALAASGISNPVSGNYKRSGWLLPGAMVWAVLILPLCQLWL